MGMQAMGMQASALVKGTTHLFLSCKQAEPQAAEADAGHAAASDGDAAAASAGGAEARQNELKQKASNVTALVSFLIIYPSFHT